MDQQTSDTFGFVHVIGRYRNLIGFMAIVGLITGLVFSALHPTAYTARATVAVSASSCLVPGAICGGPAFSAAAEIKAGWLNAYPGSVVVDQKTPDVVTLTASAGTAAQAMTAAEAAVNTYIANADSPNDLSGQVWVPSQVIEQPTVSGGTVPPQRLLAGALFGALAAGLLGIIAALAGAQTTIDPRSARRRIGAGA
jgi:hypothetical protein